MSGATARQTAEIEWPGGPRSADYTAVDAFCRNDPIKEREERQIAAWRGEGEWSRLGSSNVFTRGKWAVRMRTCPSVNRLWVADLTRILAGEGVLWLASVRDAFANRIVGWATHPGKAGGGPPGSWDGIGRG